MKKKKARVPGEGCRYRLFPPTLSHGKVTPVSQQHVISDSDVPVHVCVLLLLYLFREKLRYASGEIERKKMIRANHAKNSSDDRENKKDRGATSSTRDWTFLALFCVVPESDPMWKML